MDTNYFFLKELLNEDCVEARHILEERGKVELCEDFDEEKKFSAVLGSGRYVDPNQAKVVAENKSTSGPPKFFNKKKAHEQSNPIANINDIKATSKKEENETKSPPEQVKNEKNKNSDINKKNEKDEKNANIKQEKNLNNEEIESLKNKIEEKVKKSQEITSQQSIEKLPENIEENSFKNDSKDFEKSGSLSLKSKKNTEKSLKLNSTSFFAGTKVNPNNITEFKPENFININENTTELSQKSQKEKEEILPIENTSIPLSSSKLQQSEQFKLNPTDAHLSIK